MIDNLIRLIEESAEIRGNSPVPRDYIVEALERIELGEINVRRYPMGKPTLRGVYEVALELYEKSRQTR